MAAVAQAANGKLYALCPSFRGRLLGVAIDGMFLSGDTGTAQLGRLTTTLAPIESVSVTFTELQNLTSALVQNDSTRHFTLAPLDTIDAAMAPSAGPTVLPDVTDTIGAPIWGTGQRTPQRIFEAAAATNNPANRLALQLSTGGAYAVGTGYTALVSVTWYVAEGL